MMTRSARFWVPMLRWLISSSMVSVVLSSSSSISSSVLHPLPWCPAVRIVSRCFFRPLVLHDSLARPHLLRSTASSLSFLAWRATHTDWHPVRALLYQILFMPSNGWLMPCILPCVLLETCKSMFEMEWVHHKLGF